MAVTRSDNTITLVGTTAQFAASTTGTSVSPGYPAGYTAVRNDVYVVHLVGKTSASANAYTTPTNYVLEVERYQLVSTGLYLWHGIYSKVLTDSESAASFSVPSTFNNQVLTAQATVWRNVSRSASTNTDAGIIGTSDTGSNKGGALASNASITIIPNSITNSQGSNVTDNWFFFGSSDDNAISISTTNGHTSVYSGANYDTTIGTDASAAFARRTSPSNLTFTFTSTVNSDLVSDFYVTNQFYIFPTETVTDDAATGSATGSGLARNNGRAQGTGSATGSNPPVDVRFGTPGATTTVSVKAIGTASTDQSASWQRPPFFFNPYPDWTLDDFDWPVYYWQHFDFFSNSGTPTHVDPPHQVDDIVITTITYSSGALNNGLNQIATPSGWNLLSYVTTGNGTNTSAHYAAYWRRMTTTKTELDLAPYDVEGVDYISIPRPAGWAASGWSWQYRNYVIRNARKTGDPFDDVETSAAYSVANGNFPAVTVSGVNRTVFQFYLSNDDQVTGTVSGWTASTLFVLDQGSVTDLGFQVYSKFGVGTSTTAEASNTPIGEAASEGRGYTFTGVSMVPGVFTTVTRTASGAGTGSSTTVSRSTPVRATATGSAIGSSTATGRNATTKRTATASGAGTQTATGVRVVPRTGTASATGTSDSRWFNFIESTAIGISTSGELAISVIPPRLVAEGSVAAVTTGNLTVTLPAHQTNDILVLTVVGWIPNTTTGANLMSLSGWNQIHSQSLITGGLIDGEWAIWWRRATSNAETNPIITRPTSWDTGTDTAWAGRAYTISNAVTTATPYDDGVESAILTAANGSFPAVTVSGKGRSVFQFYVASDNLSSGAAPSPWTAGTAEVNNTGTDTGFQVFYQYGVESSTTSVASNVVAPAQGGYVFFGVSFDPPPQVASTTAYGEGFSYQSAVGSKVAGQTISKTATGNGTGTQTATRLIIDIRTATGSGSGTQTTTRVITRLRTATGSGAGTQTATRLIIDIRTATGNGTGSQTSSQLRTGFRTATGSGTGTQSSVQLRTVFKTATGSGNGTQTASFLRTVLRTGTGSGQGTQTATFSIAGVYYANGSGQGTGTATWLRTIFRTATGSGLSSQSNTQQEILYRSANGSGTSTQSAQRTVIKLRSATGSGTSSQTANFLHIKVRSGSASGLGTQTTTSLSIVPRGATGSGLSAQSAIGVILSARTATGSGLGTQTSVIQVVKLRTATGFGSSTESTITVRTLLRNATGTGTGTSTIVYIELLPRQATGSGLGTQTTEYELTKILRDSYWGIKVTL